METDEEVRPRTTALGPSEIRQVRALGAGILALALALIGSPTAARADGNRPPTIQAPGVKLGPTGPEVRYGKELRVRFAVADPDGDAVTVEADGLPAGAAFDPEVGELWWTPSRDAIGTHRIVLRASDGTATTTELLVVQVVENRPPQIASGGRGRWRVGDGKLSVALRASDPDGDSIAWEGVGLPRGASVTPDGRLTWRPGPGDLGVHAIRVRATDGEASSDAELEIEVFEEWTAPLVPGVQLALYAPSDRATYGTYRGVALELAIATWVRRNEEPGPSHRRIYVRGELLGSSRPDAPFTFIYGIGFELTLERNPRRRWLLPLYGLELGGLVQDGLGQRGQVTPHLGVHVFTSRQLDLRVAAGYVIVPEELETLRGWHLRLGGTINLW